MLYIHVYPYNPCHCSDTLNVICVNKNNKKKKRMSTLNNFRAYSMGRQHKTNSGKTLADDKSLSLPYVVG